MPHLRSIDQLREQAAEDSENVAPIRDATSSSTTNRTQPQGSLRPAPLSENSPIPVLPTAVVPVSKTKLKVTIKNWTGVATWRWIANDDTCGICRIAFDGCCPECKTPGDDCPVVWGACTHCFHIHCIMKWIDQEQAQQLCPMCRQEWKFKE